MRKMKKVIFTVFTFMFATSMVGAAKCDFTEKAELNHEVVNIKASYEEAQEVWDPSDYSVPDDILGTEYEKDFVEYKDFIKVSIINLTEHFYIEVSNDYDRNKQTYYYKDSKDGVITFDWKNTDKVTNFTIKVYASSETGCEKELYRTIYLTVPRLNFYYSYAICDQATDYYLCKKYVTYDDVEFDVFIDRVNKYIEKQEASAQAEEEDLSWFSKAGKFISEHKVIFITSGVVLIVGAGVAVAVILRKRRSSVI